MENEKEKENATQISKTYTYEVRISRKGRKAVYKGIYDSGNLLVSQITGQESALYKKSRQQNCYCRKKSQR